MRLRITTAHPLRWQITGLPTQPNQTLKLTYQYFSLQPFNGRGDGDPLGADCRAFENRMAPPYTLLAGGRLQPLFPAAVPGVGHQSKGPVQGRRTQETRVQPSHGTRRVAQAAVDA